MMSDDQFSVHYDQNKEYLRLVRNGLHEILSESLEGIHYVDAICGRVKKESSLLIKYKKKPEMYSEPLFHIEDVIGFRILVLLPSAAKEVYEKINGSVLHPVEIEYKVNETNPKAFGYENYQGIYSIPAHLLTNKAEGLPKLFELQIRTLFQHAYSEPEHELFYKRKSEYEDYQEWEYKRKFALIAAMSWGADKLLEEQLQRFKEDGR